MNQIEKINDRLHKHAMFHLGIAPSASTAGFGSCSLSLAASSASSCVRIVHIKTKLKRKREVKTDSFFAISSSFATIKAGEELQCSRIRFTVL
ncbi:hypothetical protein [Bacillus alveayuensis]|uniref:hypothetical protein n=1 Tax=Aeribacillus alveayuensis TaxID=279215 RepID=UPI00126A6964|nr:hypothetical protein [Bacillus alveayuensis]